MSLKNISVFIVLLALACACNTNNKNEYSSIENNHTISSFVGSNSCKSCHEDEFLSWENSHHDMAMKIADSSTVLGNFEDVVFSHRNVKSSFFKKGNDFYVNTEGPDGKYSDYKIEYTFGVIPLQQYIVKFPDGAYQCLSTAWDYNENKWFHLQPDLEIKHDEWLHWTGGAMKWNTMCADCHSTNLHKNFDSQSNLYNTSYSEINVSCEACHGPSSAHVDFYENPPKDSIPPKMYMGNMMSSTELVDKCTRCHSRRTQITKVFDYQGNFLDHYLPRLLVEPIYEADGQIRDEDYVYGSFMQSKMYHNGISCRDCHDVHSLKLKKTGNGLCLNCHVPNYDTPAHHFHKQNSEGAKCIECHMPGKFYMGNDFRRDHSFRVPRPDHTVEYGVPNACNTCHDDKTAEWASDFIKTKYGNERADHFSDPLLKGYYGDTAELLKLLSDKKYPEIARATALNHYGNQQLSQEDITMLALYLNDSSALVRNEAIQSLEKFRRGFPSATIEPLLNDSIRIVRISAARYFNVIGQDMTSNAHFEKANKEYLEMMDMNEDFASGQHQIALYHQAKGNIELAITSYEKAIEIDNYFNMSRMNLALLYYQQGFTEKSEKLYLKIIEQEPEFGSSYYMLGLLYNELGHDQKALKYLAEACEKEPANVNSFYNYALKLQQNGKNDESIALLNKSLKLFPDNEKLLYVRLIGEMNSNKLREALITCEKLIEIAPANPDYRQLLERLNKPLN